MNSLAVAHSSVCKSRYLSLWDQEFWQLEVWCGMKYLKFNYTWGINRVGITPQTQFIISVNFSRALLPLNSKPFYPTFGSVQWPAAAADTVHSQTPCFHTRCLVRTSSSGCRRAGRLSWSAQMLSGPVLWLQNATIVLALSSNLLWFLWPPQVVFCFINIRLPSSVQRGHVHRERDPF